MTNLDSIFKSRDIPLPTKVRLVKAMVFPVVMYGCELDSEEGWALKNWCFWTVVLEKTLESPLDCKEIQPVHSREDHPGCSLEGMMLKLKLQYFGHLMWTIDSLEKTLMLGGIGGRRRRGRQRMRWVDGVTDCTWVWVNSRSSVMDREAWHAAIHGAAESDRTELNWRVYVNNRLSMITLYQCRFIHCNNVPTLVGVSIVGKIVYVWKYGLYEKSLYFSIQFCRELKAALQKRFIF